MGFKLAERQSSPTNIHRLFFTGLLDTCSKDGVAALARCLRYIVYRSMPRILHGSEERQPSMTKHTYVNPLGSEKKQCEVETSSNAKALLG